MASVLGGSTFTREREQRVFAYAMLASIVLHGALLFANFQFRDPSKKSDPAPRPIVARLVPAAMPALVEAAPKPRTEEPPPPPPVAKPQPAPVPVPAAKAAPKAPLVPATPAPTAPASEAPRPVAQSAPPDAPSAPASAPSSAPPSPGPVAKAVPQPPTASVEITDKGNLDQYRLAIYDAARKYKKYPRVALDNNWEGKAVIRLVIGANGMIESISIQTSTGHEILDQAALDTLRKAKPLVPIPAALRGREFGLDINFIYSLKDENA